MAIEAIFGEGETISGTKNKARRAALTRVLQTVPAEIKDEAGKTVPVKIEYVGKNIYFTEVSIEGYREGSTKIHINDPDRLDLFKGERDNPDILAYNNLTMGAGKRTTGNRRYNFIIGR